MTIVSPPPYGAPMGTSIDLITTNDERFQTFDDLQVGRTIDDVEVMTTLETV